MRRTVITVATVMLLLSLLNVKTAVEAGWVPHAQIRVSLENSILWTAECASVGLVTQVRDIERFTSFAALLNFLPTPLC